MAGINLKERHMTIAASPHLENQNGSIITTKKALAMPVKSLVVGIEPAQDLHGQDAPYPAGGGKNLLNNTASTTTSNGVTFTVNADGSVTCSGTATGTAVLRIYQTFSVNADLILNGCPWGGNYNNGYSMLATNANGSPVQTNIIDTGGSCTYLAENVANIGQIQIVVRTGTNMNGKVFYPMLRLATVTDATYAPYSNICPISGWTGANVTRAGVNIWDEEWETGTYSMTDGTKVTTGDRIRNKNYISVRPNTTYYIGSSTNATWNVLQYDADLNYVRYQGVANGTFTTASNCHFINFAGATAYYGNVYNHDIRINYPSTDTAYHPGHVQTIPITFPSEAGTVYGGTLDVTTGLLTVDRAMVDMGTLAWTKNGNTPQFYATTNPSGISDITGASCICSMYKHGNAYDNVNKAVCIYGNTKRAWVYDNSYIDTTAEDFKTAMSGVQLVYELVTPQTYQLTPTEVTLLLGENNVWADTGDITMKFWSH